MDRRAFLATGAAAAGLMTMPGLARASYRDEYRMSTVVTTAFAWGRAGETWANLITERTGGRVNARLYPGAALVQGDQTREFTALRQGDIDLICGAPGNWAGTVRGLGCFTLPFLFPDHRALDAVWNDADFMARYFDKVREAGAEPLAVGETGFRQVHNSTRPIITPDDLHGLKFRVPPNPMMNEVFSALGANPQAMNWADAQTALASGAVDGGENPMEIYFLLNMQTLGQRYVTKWNYMNEILLFAVNRDTWESWSSEDQDIVRAAAQEAAAANVAEVRAIFADDVARAAGIGVDVHVSTPDELAAFREATRPVYDQWKERIDPDLVAQIESIVAASR
ncbi:MAG: TRAP transporter substrate-binding protein DctP [Rhodobacter sp.]|nr:TRAP transporter substrate-binding protein DctP [Rhodobacter sp.]